MSRIEERRAALAHMLRTGGATSQEELVSKLADRSLMSGDREHLIEACISSDLV